MNVQHFNQEQMDKLKERLQELKQTLERQLLDNQTFGLSESIRDRTGELSVNDNHPADQATETYERGKDLALAENAEHLLGQINLALESMNTGKYGQCIICDAVIPYERLKAIPYTPYCKQHAEQDVSERRPVEESLLHPAFERTNLDETEQAGFDGEDAWQTVASWGNSNTPTMADDGQMETYDDMFMDEDEDEGEGFVQPLESFIATDLYGGKVSVVRNRSYYQYMNDHEGDRRLEQTDGYEDDMNENELS